MLFFKGLGATAVTLPINEYYTGMERGVIDGHIGSLGVFVTTGSYEITKYVIDYPYYRTNSPLLFNLKKWNSLPPNLQKIIEEAALEQEVAWEEIGTAKKPRCVNCP